MKPEWGCGKQGGTPQHKDPGAGTTRMTTSSSSPVEWRGTGCKARLQEEEELLCCEEGHGVAGTEWGQERGVIVSWSWSLQSAGQCYRSSPLCSEGSALKDETFWKLTRVSQGCYPVSMGRQEQQKAKSNNCCRAGD